MAQRFVGKLANSGFSVAATAQPDAGTSSAFSRQQPGLWLLLGPTGVAKEQVSQWAGRGVCALIAEQVAGTQSACFPFDLLPAGPPGEWSSYRVVAVAELAVKV